MPDVNVAPVLGSDDRSNPGRESQQEDHGEIDLLADLYDGLCRGFRMLTSSVMGHVCQITRSLNKRAPLRHEGPLIAQDILPPPGRQDFHPAFLVLLQYLFQIIQ